MGWHGADYRRGVCRNWRFRVVPADGAHLEPSGVADVSACLFDRLRTARVGETAQVKAALVICSLS